MNLYKREGRRFVKTTICDNTGEYYQKDGSFVEERTEDSIGLCIMSTTKEHVVMSLGNYLGYKFSFKDAKLKATSIFGGKGEIPKLQELMTALILFRKELNIDVWEEIWSVESITSTPCAAYANVDGGANGITAPSAGCVAGLRPIVRIPQIS